MFELSHDLHFCYGHRLLNYAGKCRHLHGHNGKARIYLRGETLDHRGMLLDFGDVKRSVDAWVDEHLDHRMLLCQDDPAIPILQEMGEPLHILPENPTAENIAKLIYEEAVRQGLPVSKVSLWETVKNCATYRGKTSS